MSTELKDCPFCGSKPTMKHIGNDHTKTRAVEVKCSNIECRVARTDKAFRNDHAWLTAVAVEGWNRRPALAASGGNAAPGLTDEQIIALAAQHGAAMVSVITAPKGPVLSYQFKIGSGALSNFARAIEAASAPNAALVAALQNLMHLADEFGIQSGVCCCGDDMKRHGNPMDCGHSPVDSGEYYSESAIEAARAALAQAGAA